MNRCSMRGSVPRGPGHVLSLGRHANLSGRKAFQRPLDEGVELLNAIQDVYLDERITVA